MDFSLESRIIDQIDAEELCPRTHKVCRRLADHLSRLSAVCLKVVRAFDEGQSVEKESLARQLWAEIEGLPLPEQGSRRILVSLLQPDAAVDFQLAGYLIRWSEDEGIPSSAILEAFDAS